MGKLKDYFIPHGGNNYRPHSLQKAAMLGMVVLVLLSFTLANLQSLFWISSEWMISTILPSVIVEMTNEERENFQVSDLRRNPELDRAAQMKAEHMAANEYFAHYSPDGVSPWHWFNQANYDFVHAGENLAIHFSDSDEVVEAWMNSPTHRANIISGDYAEIGVGTASGSYDGHRTVYVVQLFGSPAAVVAEPAEPEAAATPAVLAEAETQEETDTEEETANQQIAGSEGVVTEADGSEVSLATDRDPVPVAPTSTETEAATGTEIADVVVREDVVSLYSDEVSTSTGGVPADIETRGSNLTSDSTPAILAAVTKPQLVLQFFYSAIAFFVVGSLILSILIEIRRQHPMQIAYGAGLVAVMAALFYIHVALTSGAVIA